MKITITGPAYDTNIPNFEQQKCINWFLEMDEIKGVPHRSESVLKQTPGITKLFDFGDFSSGRASIVANNVAYVVLDDTFAVLASDGLPSYIDVLNTSTGFVSICSSPTGIMMADGTNAYFYDLNTHVFSIITDSDLPANPIGCTFIDGYYILIFEGRQEYFFSLDPINWDALQYQSVQVGPGFPTAVLADHQSLYFFCTDRVEVDYNTGNAEGPFSPIQGTLITKGCNAPATIVTMNSTIVWLGTDTSGGSVVCQSIGFVPSIISTSAISEQIATYTTTSDAFAFNHRVGQHEFYVLTFPTENVTWVYDFLTGYWHQRVSILDYEPSSPSYLPYLKAHRAKNHCYIDGKHIVLDQYTGAVAQYDENVFTEYGNILYRQRRTGQLSADNGVGKDGVVYNNQLHTYYNLVVDVARGAGLSSGQGSNPQLQLSVSRDGGYTWEGPYFRELGAQGAYNQLVKYDMLGQARYMVWDFVVTDPIRATLLGATVTIRKDNN